MNSINPQRRIGLLALAASSLIAGSRGMAHAVTAATTSSFDTNLWQQPRRMFLGDHSPADFGTSRACAKLRRKNKLRSLGISGQRI